MKRSNRSTTLWIGCLIIIYAVGVAGMLTPALENIFRWLVPVNILFAFGVTLYHHKNHTLRFWLTLSCIGILGYLLEVAGVHTGAVFGTYAYQGGLGFKLAGVPLILAVNWAFLVYTTASLGRMLKLPMIPAILFSGSCMVAYDYILEPFAIRFSFWSWEGNQIPLQNYVAWAIAAFFFQTMFHIFRLPEKNLIAAALLILQILFFSIILAG